GGRARVPAAGEEGLRREGAPDAVPAPGDRASAGPGARVAGCRPVIGRAAAVAAGRLHASRVAGGCMRAAFALAIGIGALLLFQVQFVLGKQVLPWFGGVPAVWSTCLVFFQTLLLA